MSRVSTFKERVSANVAARLAEFRATDAARLDSAFAAQRPITLAGLQRTCASIPGMTIPEKAAPLEQGRRRS